VGVAKRRVLQGLWRRLVGVGIIGTGQSTINVRSPVEPRPDTLTL
jgi:hypothetical protein